MFTQSIRLGKILGIPFGVNYSWFIIFILITLSLTTQFRHLHPGWTYAEHLTFGVVTSILFFASVLLHELGHSVVALRYNIPVKSITLFVFGGVAQIGKEPEKPMHEFNIAIAGPIVSGALSVLFYLLMFVTYNIWEGVSSLGEWLGGINFALAVFNLIPGFPLDGGRVLRAIAWKLTDSYERATTIAAGSGQFFAYAFIAYGIFQALTGNFFSGLWVGFIGWFLLNAAQASTMQLQFRSALKGITAGDVMVQECTRLPGTASVAELVEHYMLKTGVRCSMVVDGDRLRGLVTLHEIKQVPREQWATTSLNAIMLPEERLAEVTPETPIDTVLQRMNDENISQVPVVKDGKLLGVIGRDRLLAIVQTHLELKA
ncbi:MAG TPA: site-2 protease family protein [Bacteroidota bacterium]|nr:site-2 protease family protein [Bacteroidota bacterium]